MSSSFDITRLRTRTIKRTSRFFQQLVTSPEPWQVSSTVALPMDSNGRGQTPAHDELHDVEHTLIQDTQDNDPTQDGDSTQDSDSTHTAETQSSLREFSASSSDNSSQSIYPPSERWTWIKGHEIIERGQMYLSEGAMCRVYLKTVDIGSNMVNYIAKCWQTMSDWQGSFYSELALYKKHMKHLQGDVIPSIITVLTAPASLEVAMEPPHRSFWIEASPDMPLVLKERCVEAFRKIHACGVLHGDVELRHMLIGGDGQVTIIDFQNSRALEPIEALHLKRAEAGELRREMRKVKVMLDYPGARELEYENFKEYRKQLSYRNGLNLKEEERWDLPITNQEEWNSWIEISPLPARFIMPGQSPDALSNAIQEFLDVVDPPSINHSTSLADTDTVPRPDSHPSRKRSREDEPSDSLSAPKRARVDSEVQAASTEAVDDRLRRKRKQPDSSFTGAPPPKRRRIDKTPEIFLFIQEIQERITIPPPPNLRYCSLPKTSERTDEIFMNNLAMCALEGLPHPTLLELFPKHKRWRDPDVSTFLFERRCKRVERYNEALENPSKRVRMPKDLYARGSLRRRMDRIQRRLAPTKPTPSGSRTEPLLKAPRPATRRRVRFNPSRPDDEYRHPFPAIHGKEKLDLTGQDAQQTISSDLVSLGTNILQRSIRPFIGWMSTFDL